MGSEADAGDIQTAHVADSLDDGFSDEEDYHLGKAVRGDAEAEEQLWRWTVWLQRLQVPEEERLYVAGVRAEHEDKDEQREHVRDVDQLQQVAQNVPPLYQWVVLPFAMGVLSREAGDDGGRRRLEEGEEQHGGRVVDAGATAARRVNKQAGHDGQRAVTHRPPHALAAPRVALLAQQRVRDGVEQAEDGREGDLRRQEDGDERPELTAETLRGATVWCDSGVCTGRADWSNTRQLTSLPWRRRARRVDATSSARRGSVNLTICGDDISDIREQLKTSFENRFSRNVTKVSSEESAVLRGQWTPFLARPGIARLCTLLDGCRDVETRLRTCEISEAAPCDVITAPPGGRPTVA